METTALQNTKIVLAEIFARWDSRADSYRDVLYSAALLKADDGSWRNVFTFFKPQHKSDRTTSPMRYDYGNLIIAQDAFSLKDAKATLTRVAEKEQFSLPRLPNVRLAASLYPQSSPYFWRSDAKTFPVGFSFFDYRSNVDQSCKASPPTSIVWVPDLPLYPSGRIAIEDLLHTHVGDDRAYEGVLAVLVPDYRGKISQIRLLNNGISVEIACPPGEAVDDLGGKLYSEDGRGNRVMEDLEFTNDGIAVVPTSDFPRQLVVLLFSKKTGELIDERIFDAQLPFRPADLTIEEVEQTIENLIRGGESDTIEFKTQIPQRHEAIAATAVAFANRSGGKIFVGVDNDAQIVGFTASGAKETLTNILRDRC